MQELIERLSKATGPDHAIDIEIARMRGVTVMMQNDDGNGSHEDTYWEYTKSIDDALTLVPEGWGWQVSNRAPVPHTGRAFIHNNERPFVGLAASPNPLRRTEEHTAATPAIALCIAALKAQQGTTRG
jgi:hypothetical protein